MPAIKKRAFIKPDPEEEKLGEFNQHILKSHRMVTRGLYCDKWGWHIKPRDFISYTLKKRVNIFRLVSGEYYIKNYQTRAYQKADIVLIGAIFMIICDEYDTHIYEETGDEGKLFDMLNKLCPTYEKVEESNEEILFPNGIFSLKDYTFDTSFNSKGVFTHVAGFEYNADAECLGFEEAVSKIFNGDIERVQLLQELFGYTYAYGVAHADRLGFLFGQGRNGKSCLCEVLRKLHGTQNVSGVSLEKLCERFQLAPLYGKRVNICPEAPQSKLMNSSMLKALTGGDPVTIERKYMDPFTSEVDCKILAMSNHYLRSSDSSFGFWKRIITIPFEVSFLSADELKDGNETDYAKIADPELGKKLDEELPGIFNWSIQGLRRLRDNDWTFTTSVACEKLKEQMMMLNKPVDVFVLNCVDRGNLDPKAGMIAREVSADVHKKFIAWAAINEIELPDLRHAKDFHREFRDALHSHGIPFELHKRSIDYYDGIFINPNCTKRLF